MAEARSSVSDDGYESLAQLRTRALYIFNLVLPKQEDIPPAELELLELVIAIRAAREILRPAVMQKGQAHTWGDNASSDPNLTTGVDSGAPKTAAETRAENVKIVVEDVSLLTVVKRIRAYEFILLRPFLMIAVIMLLWVFGGAVVFLFTLDPYCVVAEDGVERCKAVTYPMAIYYATQAGFSVGFGLLSERPTGVRWYTILHGLIGLTIIAAGLTLFLLRPGGRLAQRIAGDPEHVWKESTKDEEMSRYAYRMYRKLRRLVLMELPLVVLFLVFSTCVVFQVSAIRHSTHALSPTTALARTMRASCVGLQKDSAPTGASGPARDDTTMQARKLREARAMHPLPRPPHPGSHPDQSPAAARNSP
jgi:hypothetical protein